MRRVLVLSLAVAALVWSSVVAAAQDRFVGPLPSDSDVAVERDVAYATREGRQLRFDLYKPALVPDGRRVPVAIFLNGVGAEWLRGHVQYTSWGRYVTTAGLAGVTMDSTEATVAADFDALVSYLAAHADELGIDATRIVVWACSANVRAAFPILQAPGRPAVVGGVLYYGAAEPSNFRQDRPLLVVRAGLDNVPLNRGLDGLAAAALAANAPVTVMNYPSGRHAFDIRDDAPETREILSDTLAFMARAVQPRDAAARRAAMELAGASAALQAGDWATAARLFATLAERSPADPEVHQRLGEARLETGDLAGAIAALERSLTLGTPNAGIVTVALIRAYTRQGDIDRAFGKLEQLGPRLRFFADALRQDPDLGPLRADPRFARIVRIPRP